MNRFSSSTLTRKNNVRLLYFNIGLVAYAVCALLAIALQILVEGDLWLIFIHLSGSLLFYWLWYRSKWGNSQYEAFGAVVLLSSAFYRFLNIFDTVINGLDVSSWPVGVFTESAWWAVFRGEILTVVGLILVVLSWRWAIGHREIDLGFSSRGMIDTRIAWFVYVIGVLIEISTRIYGVNYQAIQQFILVIHYGSIAAIYYITHNRSKVSVRVLLAIGLGIPLTVLAFGGGMKENIVLPLLPAIFIAWKEWTSAGARVLMVTMGITIMAFLQVFTNFTRKVVWLQGYNLSLRKLLGDFISQTDSIELISGFSELFKRLNLTEAHAWTIAIADRSGFLTSEVFGGFIYVFIPRFLWPDKPVFQPGLLQTARIYGIEYAEKVNTAIASGLFTELYLGGGLIAVVCGALLFGFLIGKTQLFAYKLKYRFAIVIYNFSLIIIGLRLDEISVIYAFAGPLIFLVYFIVLVKLIDLIGQVLFRSIR